MQIVVQNVYHCTGGYEKKDKDGNNYTMPSLLDKLDVLKCLEDANHSLRIGEMLAKHAEIYEALRVEVPISSC